MKSYENWKQNEVQQQYANPEKQLSTLSGTKVKEIVDDVDTYKAYVDWYRNSVENILSKVTRGVVAPKKFQDFVRKINAQWENQAGAVEQKLLSIKQYFIQRNVARVAHASTRPARITDYSSGLRQL